MAAHGHGHSVAAWTGSITLMVASAVLAVGIFFDLMWLTWVGIVLVVLGVAAWYGLTVAGYGEQKPERRPRPGEETEGRSTRPVGGSEGASRHRSGT